MEAVNRCAGINGATNRKFLDLYPPNADLDTIKKIIYQKTVTLFEIAFVFGWLFGGGSASRLSEVNACAYHLGMAFQIADDLLDETEDASNPINIAKAYGRERALSLFEEEMEAFTCSLKNLGLWNIRFQEVAAWLRQYGTAVQAT